MPKVRLRLNHTYPSEERVKGWIKGVVLFILVLYFLQFFPALKRVWRAERIAFRVIRELSRSVKTMISTVPSAM